MPESYMEKALLKIARQLNAFDEASLTSLWERYADKVQRFEPTKRWEEAALMLAIIQGMRMKNQLFNHHWAQSRRPDEPLPDFDFAGLSAPERRPREEDAPSAPEGGEGKPKRGKLLELKPRK
jgi:hypothetical protein